MGKLVVRAMLGIIVIVGLNARVVGQNSPALTPNQKGDYLYHACKAVVKQMDDGGSEPSAEWRYCAGYFDGFIESHLWYETTSKDFCFDENSSNAVLIRVYVQYMEKNPKLLDALKAVGVALTLRDNYPCSPKSSK